MFKRKHHRRRLNRRAPKKFRGKMKVICFGEIIFKRSKKKRLIIQKKKNRMTPETYKQIVKSALRNFGQTGKKKTRLIP